MRYSTRAGLRVLSVSLCLAMVIGACDRGETQAFEPAAQDLESRAAKVRRMYELRQWEALAPAAGSLLEELQPGSPDWFLTSSFIVASAYERWDTETLERVAGAALSQAHSMRVRELTQRMRDRSRLRSSPSPSRAVPESGPDPVTARALLEIKMRLAYLLQHRGQHREALNHLSLAPQDLQPGGSCTDRMPRPPR